MRIELDWQAENEDGEWETVAAMRRQPGPHLPPWIWSSALAFALLLAAVGYLTVRYRYQRALAWTAFQIQGAIDSEAQALVKGDVRLYLAQQDARVPDWYTSQADSSYLAMCIAQVLETQTAGRPAASPPGCLSPIQGQVQHVELRGDVAWVEVITGDGRDRVRQARFYRRTDHGWLHTAPRPEFWNDPVERSYGAIIARYDGRDTPYVEPLIEQIGRVTADVGRSLGGFQIEGLEVAFTPEPLSGELPIPSEGSLTLPSPWISGIPLDGEWGPAYLDELRYRVAYAVTDQFLGSGASEQPEDRSQVSRLQRALASEYAAWYAEQDIAQAPILGRIVRRHGAQALPSVLQSTGERSWWQFVSEWLGLSPAEGDAYLRGMNQIVSDARNVRRWETRMLVVTMLEPYSNRLVCNEWSEFCS